MQTSIVIIGLGETGAHFASTFTTDKAVARYIYTNDRLSPKNSGQISDREGRDKLVTEITAVFNAAKDYEISIVVATLGDSSGSVLMPELIRKLTNQGTNCFALVTIPMRSVENAERISARAITKQLERIIPPRHSSVPDVEKFKDTLHVIDGGFYRSIAVSFFKSETEYILKHGALYRIFNLSEDEDGVESNAIPQLESFSVELLLYRLNELWRKRVKRNIHFDEDREESEKVAIEIRERGYTLMGQEQFASSLLPGLVTDDERHLLLKKVRDDKAKVIEEKRYEEAARLRDKEKRLMSEMVSLYFAQVPDDYFLLLRAADKTVVYRFCNIHILDDFVRKISKVP